MRVLRFVLEFIAFLVILMLVSFVGVLVNLHTGLEINKGFMIFVMIVSLFIWMVSRNDL